MRNIKNSIAPLLFFLTITGNAQTIPGTRTVEWKLAGFRDTIPAYNNIVNIVSYGGVGDSITVNNNSLQNAISSFGGMSGVIYFPAGTYLFTSSINLPDSVVIRGQSSSSTRLKFNLSGNNQDLFNVQGTLLTTQAAIIVAASKDSASITVNSVSGFSADDYIRITQNDSSLITSSWAYGSVGQIVQITSISGNTIYLNSPLRKSYSLSENSKIAKLIPKKYVGFECFKIERVDSTSWQTSNINFNYAVKCWVIGVESYKTNYAHITASVSSNIVVRGCYFHHAFNYGGGGKGYGLMLQFTSGEILAENNIFNNLRHSMILQAGANGNVFAYNYSVNPFWSQSPFPNNSAGDMVLHGNYPYTNLFEGNICQNIVIDNSHGINGPYNTFFRNRAELYGLFMNSNPASNDQNFAGNEIPNTGILMGNYILNGTGHFEFGNNVRGTITPANTINLPDSSYYLNSFPGIFPFNYPWPSVGTPYPYNQGSIPAKDNYAIGNYTNCVVNIPVFINDDSHIIKINIYPNPFSTQTTLRTDGLLKNATLTVYNSFGQTVKQIKNISGQTVTLFRDNFPSGLYFLRVTEENKIYTDKLVITDK